MLKFLDRLANSKEGAVIATICCFLSTINGIQWAKAISKSKRFKDIK